MSKWKNARYYVYTLFSYKDTNYKRLLSIIIHYLICITRYKSGNNVIVSLPLVNHN